MWNSTMLKENAKSVLKSFYWTAFLASLIFILLTGGLSSGGGSSASASADLSEIMDDYSGEYSDDYSEDYSDEDLEDFFNEYYGEDYSGEQSQDGAEESTYDEFIEDFSQVFEDAVNDNDFSAVMGTVGAIILVGFLIGSAISLAYRIFFASPVTVGYNRFFLDGRMGFASIGTLFSQFTGGRYGATVKTMFMMELKLWLWSLPAVIGMFATIFLGIKGITNMESNGDLIDSVAGGVASILGTILLACLVYSLLLIPQMIKRYEYYLVPYLMAENPSISTARAFEISRNTMKGEKLRCFGLTLSFIGWFILGGMAGGILGTLLGGIFGGIAASAGMAFVYPYLYATLAEFYCCMREKALASGFAADYELNGVFGRASSGTPYPDQTVYTGGYGNMQSSVPSQSGQFYQPTTGNYNAAPQEKPPVDYTVGKMDEITFPDTNTVNTSDTASQEKPAPDYTVGQMDEIIFPEAETPNTNDDEYNGPEIQ